MIKVVFTLSAVFVTIVLISCSVTKPVNRQQPSPQQKDAGLTNNSIETNHINSKISLLLDSNLTNAHIGVCVFEPATNTYLHNYQSNKYFIPSSNTKIATCYAAMKYLGDSLIGLQYDENDSTIFIEPTGDPSFLHQNFQIQKAFNWLKSSNKKIVLSSAKFLAKPLGKGWSWDDYEEPYMAERSAFPMYGNTVKFYYNNGYKSIPRYFETLTNKGFEERSSITKLKVSRSVCENFFDIHTGKKDTSEITFNTQQNSHFLADLLADTLHKKIISGNQHITTKKIYSQPTDSLLKPMMHNSDNFFAEQTLLMISLHQLGFMSDEKIIDTLLKTDFSNLPQKPKWVDGSGLSRYNLFSPKDFVFILNKMKNEFSWQRITNIFPTSNQGTLKGYYKNYTNKIFAKTGSLSNNFSLSGFVITKQNKQFIFSIIINNHQTTNTNIRLAIENFVASIIENN